jgi:hypothetical protein
MPPPPTGQDWLALCEAPIRASEIEYELEFVSPDAPGRKVIRFHSKCELIWNDERLRLR